MSVLFRLFFSLTDTKAGDKPRDIQREGVSHAYNLEVELYVPSYRGHKLCDGEFLICSLLCSLSCAAALRCNLYMSHGTHSHVSIGRLICLASINWSQRRWFALEQVVCDRLRSNQAPLWLPVGLLLCFGHMTGFWDLLCCVTIVTEF